jgi:hypothetical protein
MSINGPRGRVSDTYLDIDDVCMARSVPWDYFMAMLFQDLSDKLQNSFNRQMDSSHAIIQNEADGKRAGEHVFVHILSPWQTDTPGVKSPRFRIDCDLGQLCQRAQGACHGPYHGRDMFLAFC